VSLGDVAATVVDLLDIASGTSIPGESLAHFWSEAPPTEPVPALSEVSRGINTPAEFPVSRGDMKSLVDADHHYIRSGDGREELYATEDDPDEQVDLATGSEATSVLSRLRTTLEALLRRNP
jgi:arylsulfatase A-like enzyme